MNSILANRTQNFINAVRRMSAVASVLKYKEYGDPAKVVEIVEEQIPDPAPNEVLVKILAAPVNPADINTIQGKYAIRPPLPAIPGNECCGEVLQVGADVKSVKTGDKITPFARGSGTWRTHALFKETDLIILPKTLGLAESATVNVNPATAYRMLKDFATLKPGDTVIQNGANSACGQIVFQLCREWGLNCVGVVRDRPEIEQLVEYLKLLGAAEILLESELRTTTLFKNGKLAKPKLALNCVGGKNALEIVRHLAQGAVMVTYGGMSREPVTVPTASLIFNDIRFVGYWMTRWTQQNGDSPERVKMFNEIVGLMSSGKIRAPQHQFIDFREYKYALENTLRIQGFVGKKFILDFSSQ